MTHDEERCYIHLMTTTTSTVNGWQTTGRKVGRHAALADDQVTQIVPAFVDPTRFDQLAEFDTLVGRAARPQPVRRGLLGRGLIKLAVFVVAVASTVLVGTALTAYAAR